MNSSMLQGTILLHHGETLALGKLREGKPVLVFKLKTEEFIGGPTSTIPVQANGQQAEYIFDQWSKDSACQILITGKVRSYQLKDAENNPITDGEGYPIFSSYISVPESNSCLKIFSTRTVVARNGMSAIEDEEETPTHENLDDSKVEAKTSGTPEVVKEKAGKVGRQALVEN